MPCALWLISVQSFTCAFLSLSSKFLHYSIKDFETWVIVGEYHPEKFVLERSRKRRGRSEVERNLRIIKKLRVIKDC